MSANATTNRLSYGTALSQQIRGAIQKFLKYINKNYHFLPGSYSAPSPSK
jgi:hypothetical protein